MLGVGWWGLRGGQDIIEDFAGCRGGSCCRVGGGL